VPFIAIAARRNPQWLLDVFVSRQAVRAPNSQPCRPGRITASFPSD
jgi:hypothetical protein